MQNQERHIAYHLEDTGIWKRKNLTLKGREGATIRHRNHLKVNWQTSERWGWSSVDKLDTLSTDTKPRTAHHWSPGGDMHTKEEAFDILSWRDQKGPSSNTETIWKPAGKLPEDGNRTELRSLKDYLLTQSQGRHDTDHLDETGIWKRQHLTLKG